MRKSLLIVVIALLGAYSIAYAQPETVFLSPFPGTGNSGNFDTYVKAAFNIAIGIAGVLAVVMIIIGGLQYMSTDAISGKSDARDRITAAVGGLLLALAAFIILQTINDKLVNFNLPSVNVGIRTTQTAPLPGGGPGGRTALPSQGCTTQSAASICTGNGGTLSQGCPANQSAQQRQAVCCSAGGSFVWVLPQQTCPP